MLRAPRERDPTRHTVDPTRWTTPSSAFARKPGEFSDGRGHRPGDHLGHKGVKVGGGVGLVVGAPAPPPLAATAVGAAVGGLLGKFARKRVSSGIGEKMDEALPPGSAGVSVIAIYDHAHAEDVDKALANAIRKSTAQIDKASAKELKEGLAEAGAGLAG